MTDNSLHSRLGHYAGLKSFYEGRKVLVAGADGFLGSNCVRALHSVGAVVSVLSRRTKPRATGFAGAIFRGDMREATVTGAAVAGQEIVFDFAGSTGATDSNSSPVQNFDIDVVPHLVLFRSCAESPRPPLVIFCSSRLVYGRPQYLPVDERHPLNPGSIYAAHKITVENYLRVLRETHHLHSCALRLSNPFGPSDEHSTKTYGVINRFIRMALEKKPITIYGDGHQIRDYIHIDDALLAFMSVAASDRCRNEIFNLGGSDPMRLCETVELIAKAAGGTPIEFVPWPEKYKSVETGDYCTDLTKLHHFVNLPRQASFAEGLQSTIAACATDR